MTTNAFARGSVGPRLGALRAGAAGIDHPAGTRSRRGGRASRDAKRMAGLRNRFGRRPHDRHKAARQALGAQLANQREAVCAASPRPRREHRGARLPSILRRSPGLYSAYAQEEKVYGRVLLWSTTDTHLTSNTAKRRTSSTRFFGQPGLDHRLHTRGRRDRARPSNDALPR